MENITNEQRELTAVLRERDPAATVRWNDARGTATALRGRLLDADELGVRLDEDPEAVLRRFLEDYGPLVGPSDLIDDHRFVRADRSHRGHLRIRATQTIDGVPVHGASLVLFADDDGVFRAQSGLYRDPEVHPLVYRGRPVSVEARAASLRKRLTARLEDDPEGARFMRRRLDEGFGDDQIAAENFPLAEPPTHCLYPTKQGLRHAFRLHAYQRVEWVGADGETRSGIDLADLVVDIATGRTMFIGARLGAWTDVVADGRSTLKQSGNYITRPLIAVREDGADRLLVNRGHTPHIITHDAGGTDANLETQFKNDNDISRDADGHWNSTTTSCTTANRQSSQQPETDGHFFAEEAFNFYDDLGWDGLDNGEWGTAPCVVRVAAHIGMDADAYFWRYIVGGRHHGYLAFYDGECDGTSVAYDFLAGDPGVFAHEYQHAVTYFGAVDNLGVPGYLETTGWHRAIHEGVSDSMAGLRTGEWRLPGLWPNGVCTNGKPWRRMEYPRSSDTKSGSSFRDHYDDAASAGSPYTNSTILSHALYLAGQGGVHERSTRAPELIPVLGAGRTAIAEILHEAVTELFDGIGANATDGHTMIDAANLILEAAEDVTESKRSCEYVALRRALYAVGLFPYDSSYSKLTYGGEACMLPWTYSWRHSQPYLSFPAWWYRSPDLFINNGAGAQYDADVGVENSLYARVRNIGDQALNNVTVRFFFRAHGTNLPPSSTQWKPCQDSSGNDCVLTLATLAAGGLNFTDADNPPLGQAAKWFLDPSEVVAGVDHFCLRAEIECATENHDHDCPNRVQSNVSFSPIALGTSLDLTFNVSNWNREPIMLELEIDDASLPDDVELRYVGPGDPSEMPLKPDEEVPLQWALQMPDERRYLKPPYEGAISGDLVGSGLRGGVVGMLHDVEVARRRRPGLRRGEVAIAGRLVGRLEQRVTLSGRLEGVLDRKDGRLTGKWSATIAGRRGRVRDVELEVDAELRPTRAIHFGQRIDGEPVGGVTYAFTWPTRR